MRQGKTTQDKVRHDKTKDNVKRQYKIRLDNHKVKQHKTRPTQDNIRQYNTTQHKTKQNNMRLRRHNTGQQHNIRTTRQDNIRHGNRRIELQTALASDDRGVVHFTRLGRTHGVVWQAQHTQFRPRPIPSRQET